MQTLSAESKARILDKFPACMAYQCLYELPYLPFASVSEGSEALTGYPPGILSGKRMQDLIHPEDVHKLESAISQTLSVGAPLEVGFRITTKDGAEKRVLSRSRVAKTDSAGMPYLIEGFFTDVTKEIQLATTQAENRDSVRFWTKMGYEVRTPMNVIIGLTELGLREDIPENIREYAQTIKNSSGKLMLALENIMDYIKIESGQTEYNQDEYSLFSVVNDALNIAKDGMGDLAFHLFIDSHIPGVLVGDESKLRKVLQTLMSNAIKFTDKGYVALSVEGTVENDMVHLTLTVEDTGRGIKREDYGNLFKEFTQFDSKTIEGTGLGLSVARYFLGLMGGEISFVSEYGVGSVFTVTLPQVFKGERRPLCRVENPDDKNVLILERKYDCAQSIARTLTNLGVACTAVTDKGSFAEAAAEGSFTHVFADASFGAFLYDEYKAAHPDFFDGTKIVLLSKGADKPLFCLPAAAILNDSHRGGYAPGALFTAPDACILVVDDVIANFIVASGFLKPYGMKVDFCESGAEAIEAVKHKKYDLILMDHLMPLMTGSEATAAIRRLDETACTDCKNVPIIALTANTEYSSKTIFRDSGINDFLYKPIDGARLRTALDKWLPAEKKQAMLPGQANPAAAPRPLPQIPGIDSGKGLAKTGGNADTYMRVIKNFYENSRRIITELERCTEQGDLKNYIVYIHALASIAETIGANETANAAHELEEASVRGDLASIVVQTPGFLEKLNILLSNIRPEIWSGVDAMSYQSPPAPTPTGDTAQARKKILLIDDTDSYLMILDDILAGDYETLSSLDGEDGLETALNTKPDLIMLDLIMPGMSGFEVLDILKHDEALMHIPVILMSAKEDDAIKEKGFALGASGYIKKPFTPAIVMEAIQSAI